MSRKKNPDLLPLLAIGAIGVGAYWYTKKAAAKKTTTTAPATDTCAEVTITMPPDFLAKVVAWEQKWPPTSMALEAMTDFYRMLAPQCTWPPPAPGRKVIGDKGSFIWEDFAAKLQGKTLAQAKQEGLLNP